ncbi:SLAM family member 9-like isoform 2-T2 [Liasis olivaceus]
MARGSTLGLWLPILLLRAGLAEPAAAKELNGVLGESVTFQLKASPPFQTISWSKSVSGQPSIVAVLTFQERCDALTPLPAFRKRVTVSEDCRELRLSHLDQEDWGRYAAQIVLPSNATEVESFDLRVSRRLLDSQLRVTCIPDGGGNGTWQLNCSTGALEDGVEFSWIPAIQGEGPTLGNSTIKITSEDLDLNVTCRAENRVSNASTTVSLKEACAENTPATKGWILAVIVPVLLIIVIVAVAICVLKKKAAERRWLSFAQGSGTEDRAKSDSTLIGDGPKGARGKKDRPPRKAAQSPQEMPQTIYIAVQHPKQSPLQTDDEKMRKRQHSRRSQEEKTVYSEVTKSQEARGLSCFCFFVRREKNGPVGQLNIPVDVSPK